VLARPKFLNPFGCTSATECLWRFFADRDRRWWPDTSASSRSRAHRQSGHTPRPILLGHANDQPLDSSVDRRSARVFTCAQSIEFTSNEHWARCQGMRSRIKRSAMFCAVRRSILPPKTTDDAGQDHEDGGERRIEHKMLFQSNLKRRQLHLKPKILSYTGSARMTQVREMQCRRP
jgi:hypothetical protein